ncbi:hypothetical protein [Brachybacterium tyrofermentans]|uniref:hypothetical protein n=1 Tax=Brachybacterium tyrofermentans TaxID=47848 RepID=UPI00186793A3|nr:hypothetical protein [Brachybacterium tyrofermentans]
MTDANSVIRSVNQAEEIHDGLKVRGEIRSHNGPAAPGASGSRPPTDISMLDLAVHIEELLQSWSRLVHEESSDDLPADNPTAQALFMRQRAIWIAGAAWAPDMLDELDDATRKGTGMLGMLPPRTYMPEPCGICHAVQWIYHERPPVVRCQAGHESELQEHLQGREAETVTHAEAAWVLGITRRGVGMAVKRGRLTTGADGRVTLESVRVRLAKASMCP